MNRAKSLELMVMLLMVAVCSPKIYETVQLMDANMQPIPATNEAPKGRW